MQILHFDWLRYYRSISSSHRVAKVAGIVNLLISFYSQISIITLFLGLYAAAHDLGIEWVVIKGVSNYAGDNTSASDDWRRFSSLMAASLVAHILRNANVFKKWPHYEKPGT